MRMTRLYRLWLSIIVTNVINLSMIFLSIKSGLKTSYDNLKRQSQKRLSQSQKTRNSQLSKMRKDRTLTVAIVGDKAYWVHDNTFYESNVIDGHIDKDSAKPIDAFSMSKKKFDQLLDILDNII